MLREDLPIKKFRLIYFPIHLAVEIALVVFFLVLEVYDDFGSIGVGFFTGFGWLFATPSILLAAGILVLFLTSFNLKSQASEFLRKDNFIQNFTYALAFLCLARIGIFAVGLMYVTPLAIDRTPIYLIIIGSSLFTPCLLYFLANFRQRPTQIFALTKEAPLSVKLTGFWLLFLTGAMQILSEEITILIIGLFLLITGFYYFTLTTQAVIVAPIVLIIHFVFSEFFAGAVLFNLDNPAFLVGYDSATPVIILVVMLFIIPGLCSLGLSINFFRKKVQRWIRSIQPAQEYDITFEEEDVDFGDENFDFDEELE